MNLQYLQVSDVREDPVAMVRKINEIIDKVHSIQTPVSQWAYAMGLQSGAVAGARAALDVLHARLGDPSVDPAGPATRYAVRETIADVIELLNPDRHFEAARKAFGSGT